MTPINKAVAVVGPTGSGKTKLAVQLAKKYNGVIISADSRQVYRGLDIGTNKEGTLSSWHDEPSRVLDGVHQLLIDITEPGVRFTLYDYLTEARRLMGEVSAAGSLPIITGGTGLYATALIEGYQPGGGRHAQTKTEPGFATLVLQMDIDRAILNARSDERFARVFDDLVEETRTLINAGVSADWLEALGLDYRYAAYFLNRQMNREIAIQTFQRESRAYIRRQLTWWRHHNNPELTATFEQASQLTRHFLER